MSTVADAVIGHLEMLHGNRQLIAQMYTEGAVVRTEENSKRINQLLQLRAVRGNPALDGSYRLSPTLGRLLDEATHRSRNYTVSADFAEQMSRLTKIIDDYTHAYLSERDDDRERLLGDFDASLFEMAEDMNDFLLHVRTTTDNYFGNVRVYREKEKQNQHYLEQLERIINALVAFNDAFILDELNQPERAALENLYERYILANLADWRAAATDINQVLKAYLHKLRIVEPRARRIRALQMHLRRHPEYEVRSAEEYPQIPEWAYQHTPLKIRLEPDLGRQEIRDALVGVAKSIEKAIITAPKIRATGTLVQEDAPKATLIKGSPLIVVSQRLLNEAAGAQQPISAARYFATAVETMPLDQESCMMCFLTVLEKQIKASAKIIRRLRIEQVVGNSGDRLSGNLIVEDVLVCTR